MVWVKLIGIKKVDEMAVGSARTCYSGTGPVIFGDGLDYESRNDGNEAIRISTLEAGHNTTRQHLYFTFVLDKVSRQALWSFLHSHPFYNSEQVSQRYVGLKRDNFYVPEELNDVQKEIFQEGIDSSFEAYTKLQQMLISGIEKEYYSRFPARKGKEQWDKEIKKKTQEVARYIIPVAAQVYLYHTISALTLMRMYQCQHLFNAPKEQQMIVKAMVDVVNLQDNSFRKELSLLKPYDLEESLEFKLYAETFSFDKKEAVFSREFDEELGGRRSRLIGYEVNAEQNLARAVRSVLQVSREQWSDEQTLEYLLNPGENTVLADSNNLTTFTKLGSCLSMTNYIFMKKLSHTADSQNQRHRMVGETTPIFKLGEQFDVVLPGLIASNDKLRDYFMNSVRKLERTALRLREDGVAEEAVHYIAPNAIAIRILEQGNLRDRLHKFRLRLCANAQEEIWLASVEEVLQIREVHPTIGKFLLPPCGVRYGAEVRPYCPEGERYCGLPLWKKSIEEYTRGI